MKKITVFAALALVLAMPLMAASTLGVAGEVTYGVIGTGTTAVDAFGNAYLNLNATIDANNTAQLGLYANNLAASETGSVLGAIVVNDFYWQSDLGGMMGMDKKTGIDPVLSVGYGVYDLPDFNLTQSGPEGISALGVDSGNADGMFGAEIGHGFGLIALNTSVMGLVNVVLATSGTEFFSTTANQALIGAYGTVGPLSFEAGWAAKGTPMGYIPVGVKFNSAMGDISLGAMGSYVYDLNSSVGFSQWAAGLLASYQSNYTVDFAVVQHDAAGDLEGTGDVILNLSKSFGVIGTAWLNFAPSAYALFDSFEGSAWYLIGPAKVRVGYLYTTNQAGSLGGVDLNAPNANAANGGGVFLTADLSF